MDKLFTPGEAAEIAGGSLFGNSGLAHISIQKISADSRNISNPESTLFVALPGSSQDGTSFIPSLLHQGVRCFIVPETFFPVVSNDGIFIRVKNPLAALQKLAAFHRKKFNYPVVGITGSNGKTIIKEWLFQLLQDERTIVKSPRSYNSQLGVPLSLLQMSGKHNLGIFEAGISQPGEMEALERMIQPEIGIISNLGPPHQENFKSFVEKGTEKLILFKHSKTLIWCADHDDITQMVKKNLNSGTEYFSWSRKGHPADLQVNATVRTEEGWEVKAISKGVNFDFSLRFRDEASLENALHCLAFLVWMGYDAPFIRRGMEGLEPLSMRLEMKKGKNHCTLINDSYSADLSSLTVALDFLKQQNQHPVKSVFLSDILQTGLEPNELYANVGHLLQQAGISKVFCVGNQIPVLKKHFNGKFEVFLGTDDLISYLQKVFISNEAILVKGARVFEFEKVVEALTETIHQTVLEVNLTALGQNFRYFRSKVPAGTKVMAMVKAYSYGSGTHEVANALQFSGANYLCVAYADEGIALKKAGIALPIMVMNPEISAVQSIISNDLEPEIFSFRMLMAVAETISAGVPGSQKPLPIHLKFDTGMHRLGFQPDEVQMVVEILKQNPGLRVASVFSHLAASDEPEKDDFTRKQVKTLISISEALELKLGYPFDRHILNSAGILRFPEYAFEMVRLGIGLYGFSPVEKEKSKIAQVGCLKTVVSQVRLVKAGEPVGYSLMDVSEKERKIAVVAIGYADGIPRSFGNGKGKMWLNGKFAPTVGNICMDMCMLDITGLDAKEGDQVIVFGPAYPVDDFSRDAGMIPYEILTGISHRVKRVYFEE